MSNSADAAHDSRDRFRLLTFVCGPVLVLSMLATIYLAVFQPPSTLMQYRLALVLVCFALSSVSGLVFAASNVELKGALAGIGITFAGPAASWLIAILIVSWLMPEAKILEQNQLTTPATVDAIVNILLDAEQGEGWMPFVKWRESLGPLEPLLRKQEETDEKELLGSAFLNGDQRGKLADTNLINLFVYPPSTPTCKDPTLKLQEIRGTRSSSAPRVYISSVANFRDTSVNSLVFVREDSGELDVLDAPAEPLWQEVDSSNVDVLVIALFCNDLGKGDWVQVDVPKYVEVGDATVDMMFLAAKPIGDPKLWELKGSVLSRAGGIPLSFRRREETAESDINRPLASIVEWVKSLEALNARFGANPSDVPRAQFLGRFLAMLKDQNGVVLSASKLPHRLGYHVDHIQRAILATFVWGSQASS